MPPFLTGAFPVSETRPEMPRGDVSPAPDVGHVIIVVRKELKPWARLPGSKRTRRKVGRERTGLEPA